MYYGQYVVEVDSYYPRAAVLCKTDSEDSPQINTWDNLYTQGGSQKSSRFPPTTNLQIGLCKYERDI